MLKPMKNTLSFALRQVLFNKERKLIMKKIISLILAVLCVALTFCSCNKNGDNSVTTTAPAVTGENSENTVYTSGDFNYVILPQGTAKIVKYNGTSGKTDVDIPASLDGLNVTVIGENAFTEEQIVSRVILPRYLTKIEARAFNKSSVSSIWFHQTNDDILTVIDSYAFSECDNLRQVILSSSVKRIESNAFYLGNVPRYIKFYTDPEYIGSNAFDFGKNIDKLEFWHVGDISNYKNLKSYADPYGIPLVLDKNTAE